MFIQSVRVTVARQQRPVWPLPAAADPPTRCSWCHVYASLKRGEMTSERRSEADCASYEQFKSQFGELLKNITNCFHPFPVPSVVIDVDVATRNIQLKMTGHAISWSCYFYKEITVPTFYRIVNEIPRLMKAARAEAGPLNSIRHPPGRSTNSFAKVPHVANTPIKAPQCRSEKEFALQPPLLGYPPPRPPTSSPHMQLFSASAQRPPSLCSAVHCRAEEPREALRAAGPPWTLRPCDRSGLSLTWPMFFHVLYIQLNTTRFLQLYVFVRAIVVYEY